MFVPLGALILDRVFDRILSIVRYCLGLLGIDENPRVSTPRTVLELSEEQKRAVEWSIRRHVPDIQLEEEAICAVCALGEASRMSSCRKGSISEQFLVMRGLDNIQEGEPAKQLPPVGPYGWLTCPARTQVGRGWSSRGFT